MMETLRNFLQHPLTRSLDLDDPRTTSLRVEIIQTKPFLKKIYIDWYRMLVGALPDAYGPVLELGSGAGFLRELVPDLIATDMFVMPGLNCVLDGQRLPFEAQSLRAVVMIDVLHHIPQPRVFFKEALRCLRPGGKLIMIEPWVSAWSKLVYQNLHHEPFVPEAQEWLIPSEGPVSGGNGAMPWIIFQRDRDEFLRAFPGLQIKRIQPFMPFRYLVSGGVSMRSLMPGFTYGLWEGVEGLLAPWMGAWGMFGFVELEKEKLDEG